MEFSEYAAARWSPLVRSAVLMGCPRDDAEDLVQTVLTKCYRNWHRVKRARQPDAYVYRVLVNAFRDARERKWTGEIPTDELPDQLIDTDQTLGLRVRAALRNLSHQHREILVLRYYAQLSERQAATVLGIAPGTAKSRASRALAALADDPNLAEEVRDAH